VWRCRRSGAESAARTRRNSHRGHGNLRFGGGGSPGSRGEVSAIGGSRGLHGDSVQRSATCFHERLQFVFGLPALPSLSAYAAMQRIGPTSPNAVGGGRIRFAAGRLQHRRRCSSVPTRSAASFARWCVNWATSRKSFRARSAPGPSPPGHFLSAPRTNRWPAERHSKPPEQMPGSRPKPGRVRWENIGDAITVTENVLLSNAAYGGLRSTMPAVFGSGAVPAVIGELEYYARVSANFRLQ